MFLLVFGLAFASEVPLPETESGRRPWVGGVFEVSAGVGAWQVPAFRVGDAWSLPRANAHATLNGRLGRGWVAGLHVAGWSLPGARRGFRVERASCWVSGSRRSRRGRAGRVDGVSGSLHDQDACVRSVVLVIPTIYALPCTLTRAGRETTLCP